MAAKVDSSTVTYGIGVQNRYSAFLDDDDGFSSPKTHLNTQTSSMKQVTIEGKKSSNNKPNVSHKTTNKATNKQPETQPKMNNQKGNPKYEGPKRANQQPKVVQQQNSSPNSKSDVATNGHASGNNRFNQRVPRDPKNSIRRPYIREDQKHNVVSQDAQSGSFVPSTQEEKRRRQQKRVIDLKHKDPEKGEARRQQASTDSNGERPHDSPLSQDTTNDQAGKSRGPRERREGEKSFRGRGRKPEGGERRSEAPAQERRRAEPGERVQRNRNGFGRGIGSRSGVERGSRPEGNQERQKPIPNFSDKSDFPSLAS